MEQCCNCSTRQKVAKIYRGETIIGDFLLKDDDGEIVTNVDDAVVILTNLVKKDEEPLVMRLGDGIDFDNGRFRFVISSAASNTLPDSVGFEVKFVINGITRIATRDLFKVYDNKVKNY